MSHPDAGIGGITLAPLCDQSTRLRQILGLDEQIGKSGMRDIGGKGCEYDLRIRGNFNFPVARAIIGQTEATDFGIVFRRDDNLQGAYDTAVGAGDTDTIFGKDHLVVIRSHYRRLVAG